jgi:Transglycosylase SLT domain
MGINTAKLCVSFLLVVCTFANAGKIEVKIVDGKTVYYNIPRRGSTGGAQSIYYSDKAEDYSELIASISSRYGINSQLVKAVIQVESNYDPRAVSAKGAMGLMQLMPATALRYGVQSVFDPKQNIEGGVKYLKDLLDLFHYDLELTVAAYNAGENRVQQFNGIPDFLETQNYVRKVLALYNGDVTYRPYLSGKPRVVTYYKYVDEKGTTHYSVEPVKSGSVTKVSFTY